MTKWRVGGWGEGERVQDTMLKFRVTMASQTKKTLKVVIRYGGGGSLVIV